MILIDHSFLQHYDDASNCGFAMWVDPKLIPPVRSYIDYLESCIWSLELDLAALALEGRNKELGISLNDDNWCLDPALVRTTRELVPLHRP